MEEKGLGLEWMSDAERLKEDDEENEEKGKGEKADEGE